MDDLKEQTTAVAEEIPVRLTRHACCRAQGVAILTVLCGPTALGVQSWRRWAAAEGRPVAQVNEPDVSAAVRLWAEVAARSRDLVADALTLLAHHTGRDLNELREGCRDKTVLDWSR